MPIFSYTCKCGNSEEKFVHSASDAPQMMGCVACHGVARKDLVYAVNVYGTIKYHDKGLRDAAEASGKPVTSTKDVDAMERSGELRAITCPSQRHAGWRTTEKQRRRKRVEKYLKTGKIE